MMQVFFKTLMDGMTFQFSPTLRSILIWQGWAIGDFEVEQPGRYALRWKIR